MPWEEADRKLSDQMTSYWANFARSGDPNGPGLPAWPRYEAATRRVQHLDVTIKDAEDVLRPRYEALDAFASSQKK
ncbi:MAG: carboxylesterase family protein [Acidobacteria bacterium]|nr:carboxylesterase family protein [Acidobacteriota bacterium]